MSFAMAAALNDELRMARAEIRTRRIKMKPEYEPKTREQFYGYLVEECGEVLHAAGKTLRWGEESYNPELPPKDRETNLVWLRREMKDLRGAINRMEKWIAEQYDL